MKIRFQVLPHGKDLPTPTYATPGSAGLDLHAAINETLYIDSLMRTALPTGLRIEIPQGYEAQIRARSGRALSEGLAVVNAPGTIDADYRGEIKVILINLGTWPITIRRGDRIAQLIVSPIIHAEIEVADELSHTERGDKGFGSTGR